MVGSQAIVAQVFYRPLKIDADLPKDLSDPARKKALMIDAQPVPEEFLVKPRKILQRRDCGLDRCVGCQKKGSSSSEFVVMALALPW
jgi:hypothetical protein